MGPHLKKSFKKHQVINLFWYLKQTFIVLGSVLYAVMCKVPRISAFVCGNPVCRQCDEQLGNKLPCLWNLMTHFVLHLNYYILCLMRVFSCCLVLIQLCFAVCYLQKCDNMQVKSKVIHHHYLSKVNCSCSPASVIYFGNV